MNGKKDVFRSGPGGTLRGAKAERGGDQDTGAGDTGARDTGVRDTGARDVKKPGKLSRTDQHRIGDLLQRVYDDVVSEGVPDRFKTLLDRLEPRAAQTPESSEGPSTGEQAETRFSSTNLQDKETSG
jgi:hypothetical protein